MEFPKIEENPTAKTWWTAWAKNGDMSTAVTTVLAMDEADAKKVVEEQLKLPGRGAHLRRWQENGSVVTERKDFAR